MTEEQRINDFLNRVATEGKEWSVEIIGDTLTITCQPIKKRSVGDIWLDIDGKWCGMSPDGESGPWETSRAAQHAANGEYRAAAATNFRRN